MSRWDKHYKDGFTPWEIGRPDPLLVEAVEGGLLPPGRLLEIGCGTGANARYMAAAGWEVVALDLSPTALEAARSSGDGVRYEVHDLLAEPAPGGPFDAAFDRGCFHIFHDPADRARFAARVAEALRPGGCWLSVAGSTEGAPRDSGPPRRSARELIEAIEPSLELLSLRSVRFALAELQPMAWACLSRRREQPAQPSSAPLFVSDP